MAHNSKSMIEGKAPPEFKSQEGCSTFANEVLGLPTQRALSRLSDYVHQSGAMKLVPVMRQVPVCLQLKGA